MKSMLLTPAVDKQTIQLRRRRPQMNLNCIFDWYFLFTPLGFQTVIPPHRNSTAGVNLSWHLSIFKKVYYFCESAKRSGQGCQHAAVANLLIWCFCALQVKLAANCWSIATLFLFHDMHPLLPYKKTSCLLQRNCFYCLTQWKHGFNAIWAFIRLLMSATTFVIPYTFIY